MKKIQFAIFLVSALSLTACNTYQGQLVVHSPISMNSHHHLRHHDVEFLPGSYDARVNYHQTTGDVEFHAGGRKIKLKALKHYLQPDNTFSVSGAAINENWNLAGNIATNNSDTPSQYSRISCVLYTTPVWLGRVISYQPVYGTQEAMVHNHTTTQTVSFNFTSLDNTAALAEFQGSDSSSSQVVDQILGPCL